MTGSTALAIAAILHDYGSNEVQHEAAAMLRQQNAEIERLHHDVAHLLELLAIIHRDGGQYAAEHGIEKACDDAGAQVSTWLETINSVDALIEQAILAERAAKDRMTEDVEMDRKRHRVGWWFVPTPPITPEGAPAHGFFVPDSRAATFSTEQGFRRHKLVPCWIDEE